MYSLPFSFPFFLSPFLFFFQLIKVLKPDGSRNFAWVTKNLDKHAVPVRGYAPSHRSKSSEWHYESIKRAWHLIFHCGSSPSQPLQKHPKCASHYQNIAKILTQLRNMQSFTIFFLSMYNFLCFFNRCQTAWNFFSFQCWAVKIFSNQTILETSIFQTNISI